MRKLKIGLIGMLAFLLIALAACGSSSTNTTSGNGGTGSDTNSEAADNGGSAGSGGDGGNSGGGDKTPIKIGIISDQSGPLAAYGKMTLHGLKLGFEYATDGSNKIDGHPIKIISEDGQSDPKIGVQKATKLLGEDKVKFLVGTSSSASALAIEPLAKQNKTIMIAEPAVADSITGKNFNKYVFRTARNSSQDAAAAAAAIADKGVKIATLAQDYAFGHDGVSAFVEQAKKRGATIVDQEFAPQNATDVTANIQKIINAKPDYLFVVWAGANSPWKQLQQMKVQDHGIKLTTGVPNIAALKTMTDAVGMIGFTVYYYTLPDNDVNDWLVKHMKKEYNTVPDLFTPGGMSAAIAIVDALKKAGADASSDKLIQAMEGMSFDTPKGKMTFRKEDHQALQTMYKVKLEKKDGVDYPVPVLLEELSPQDTAPPIKNK